MHANKLGRTLNDRRLNARIHPLRFLDNTTNLIYLALDYLTIAVLIGGTATLCHNRAPWGVSWWLLAPVVVMAVFLIGACQHRLAGLGHEGAHYILMKNRLANELVSDLFCMFPIFTTTEQYRQIHLGHHDHVNDWHRDPELLNVGETRRMAEFPMTSRQFFFNFGVRLFWPPTLLRYTWDMIYVNALGHGVHPYLPAGAEPKHQDKSVRNLRPATWLGFLYLAVMAGVLVFLGFVGPWWMLLVAPLALWGAASIVVWLLPGRYFFRSKLRPIYPNKITSVLRLGYFTGIQAAFSLVYFTTGNDFAPYFWLLWVLPMNTSFPYLMLLRDLVQHANADEGKLTNSRVVFCHPLVRWAIFVYGQDAHLTHHLYPAVPHYNLPRLHRMLKERNREYAQHVVECHGLVRRMKPDALTAIDVMEIPTREPEGAPPALAAQPQALMQD
ncbi:MAG: fatty acid desaturase [Planctomycetia bacterium]|nr:fatty acid desaturase [Planctomycetia bacterium]